MTKIKNAIAGLVFMVGCSILMTGCERNEEMEVNHNGPIRITVNAANSTKAAAITTSSLEAAGGFVLDVIADEDYTEVDEHGTPVGTPYPAGSYITSGGAANVLYSSASHSYTPGSDVRPGTDATAGWYIYDTNGYEHYNWINGIKLRFWAMYPKDADVNAVAKGIRTITSGPAVSKDNITFTYYLPTHSTASPYTDATNQKDILFAYNERVKQKEDDNDDIDLTFNHALSEIRFCVSPDDYTFDVTLQIKSIRIVNVSNGGSCVFNGTGKIQPSTSEKSMFVWTPSTTLESYSQTYDAQFLDASAVNPTEWAGSEYDATNHYHIYTCQNVFMMIPQELSHDSGSETKVEITFYDTATNTNIVKETTICGSGTTADPYITWKPGHYYTYRIRATKIGRSISSYVTLADWTDRNSKITVSL